MDKGDLEKELSILLTTGEQQLILEQAAQQRELEATEWLLGLMYELKTAPMTSSQKIDRIRYMLQWAPLSTEAAMPQHVAADRTVAENT